MSLTRTSACCCTCRNYIGKISYVLVHLTVSSTCSSHQWYCSRRYYSKREIKLCYAMCTKVKKPFDEYYGR